MTYAGNVPAVQGGAAASVALSSAVSNKSFYLVNALLGVPGFPFAVPTQSVLQGGALRVNFNPGWISILPLPSASLEDGVATLNTLTFTSDGNVRFGSSSSGSGQTTSDGLSLVT